MEQPDNLALPIPSEFGHLSILLEEKPETLATGNQEIHAAALDATKYVFDLSLQSEISSHPHIGELLASLKPSQAPQTRSKAKNTAEKPVDAETNVNLFEFTPLKSLFVDGMDEEQIWAQLDLRTKTICRMLDFVLEGGSQKPDEEEDEEDEGTEEEDEGDEEEEANFRKVLEAMENGEDVDMEELMAKYGIERDMDDSDDSQGEDDSEAEADSNESSSEEEEEGISPLRDSEAENTKSPSRPPPAFSRKNKKGSKSSPLDDGFFDLAEFNAETERAESKSSSRGRLAGDDDSDEDDMDVDLFAPVDGNEESQDDDPEAEAESAELFYRDFFEPPARSNQAPPPAISKKTSTKTQVRFNDQVRVKKIKATGKNRSLHDDSDDDEDDEDEDIPFGGVEGFDDDEDDDEDDGEEGDEEEKWDIDGSEGSDDEESEEDDEEEESKAASGSATIQRLKQDLFADDEEPEDDSTTHQRRMATLKEQIAELEAQNVAPKEWVLMGEAGSRQRPQNSLLEEDLEFERVMKAVPVTTEDAVKSLEETIKARILANQFDDVVRLRPLEDKPFLPSKFFELKDTKSSQSLAQIYENEYVASQEGTSNDDRDGKLKKEHDEISGLWENICGKLDALCNAHFVPKQPKATISTLSNVATASLESALPTTKSTSTMLAPEEVFAASTSSLRARSELTPLEKRSLRTKERKAKKRQRDALEKSVDKFAKNKGVGSVKKQKQAALDSIVKHGKGVTVVGKKTTKEKNKK